MRIGRFRYQGEIFFGILDGVEVYPVVDPFRSLNPVTKEHKALDELELLATCLPSKAVCVGLTYRDHARELGVALPEEPILFLKPSTAVIGPGDSVVYPSISRQVDYEAEMALVIKKKARFIQEEEASTLLTLKL